MTCADGEGKFWIEPTIVLADCRGLSARQIKEIQAVIEENRDVINSAWRKHFER